MNLEQASLMLMGIAVIVSVMTVNFIIVGLALFMLNLIPAFPVPTFIKVTIIVCGFVGGIGVFGLLTSMLLK